ncbi:MAG: hypothetical protein C4348_01760, partial [Patescibacteria group bacterium]
MKLIIALLVILPLIVFAFQIDSRRQIFGGKSISTEICANGIILKIETYLKRDYFQEVEKETKTFIFVLRTPLELYRDFLCYDGIENNKSTQKSINLTPSVPFQSGKYYLGLAKKEGTCAKLFFKGGGLFGSPRPCYRNRKKDVDYSIIFIG